VILEGLAVAAMSGALVGLVVGATGTWLIEPVVEDLHRANQAMDAIRVVASDRVADAASAVQEKMIAFLEVEGVVDSHEWIAFNEAMAALTHLVRREVGAR
jgi:hypothetical protein